MLVWNNVFTIIIYYLLSNKLKENVECEKGMIIFEPILVLHSVVV